MRIYVDYDDVLCETAQALAVLAQEMFGCAVPFERIRSFDLRESFALDRAQYEALMDRAHAPEFLLALPAIAGCTACLHGWLLQGVEVAVVTGRPSSADRVSREWLARQGLAAIPVLYADKYNRNHAVPPDAPPILPFATLLQEHFDLAIDDSPVALDALQTRPAGRTIVFDRPWNRTYDCFGARVTRCCGWQEVASFFACRQRGEAGTLPPHD
jgi:hypothetical protein